LYGEVGVGLLASEWRSEEAARESSSLVMGVGWMASGGVGSEVEEKA
jgi:hypothetical protein